MEKIYLLVLMFPLIVIDIMIFFIFATGVAVYLKIFIQKKSKYKEFIVSKYKGGISRWQIKKIRPFYIFYDFFMLAVLSFLSYAPFTFATQLFNNENSYIIVSLFFVLIFLLYMTVKINELDGITKVRGSFGGAPEGIIMIWKSNSNFSKIYSFFVKKFAYIVLFLITFDAFILVINKFYT